MLPTLQRCEYFWLLTKVYLQLFAPWLVFPAWCANNKYILVLWAFFLTCLGFPRFTASPGFCCFTLTLRSSTPAPGAVWLHPGSTPACSLGRAALPAHWHGRGQQPPHPHPQLQHSLISPSWHRRPSGNVTRWSSSASSSTQSLCRQSSPSGAAENVLPTCFVSTALHRGHPVVSRVLLRCILLRQTPGCDPWWRDRKVNTFCCWMGSVLRDSGKKTEFN